MIYEQLEAIALKLDNAQAHLANIERARSAAERELIDLSLLIQDMATEDPEMIGTVETVGDTLDEIERARLIAATMRRAPSAQPGDYPPAD